MPGAIDRCGPAGIRKAKKAAAGLGSGVADPEPRIGGWASKGHAGNISLVLVCVWPSTVGWLEPVDRVTNS